MSRSTLDYRPAFRRRLVSSLLATLAFGLWGLPQAYAQDSSGPVAAQAVQPLDFGEVAVGSASATRAITFRNPGKVPMTLTGIEPAGGNFDLVHDCPLVGATLAPGGICTIDARFSPATPGAQSGVVVVTGSAGASLLEFPLSGTGVTGEKVLPSVMALGFPDTVIYTMSGPLYVQFTNNTPNPVYPYDLYISPSEGDFSQYPLINLIDGPLADPAKSADAAASVPGPKAAAGGKITGACSDIVFSGELAPGDSCFVPVYFRPYDLGTRYGTLEFGYYDLSESYFLIKIQLVGQSVPVEFPDIAVTPAALDFGGVVVGTTSTRTVKVSSVGIGPLAILGVRTFGSAFAATTDCVGSLPAGTACNVMVTCTPPGLATVQGDLYIDHEVDLGFTHVPLTCTGSSLPEPKIEVTTTGVGFGNQALGSTSSPQTVEIKSVGTAPLAVTGVVAGSPFGASSDCPPALDPGQSCHAFVTFSPTAAGRRRSLVEISSNDPERASVDVSVSGNGCRPFSIQAARRGQPLCGP